MKTDLRWYDFFFVLLVGYLLVLQIHAIWPFTIDDMFISLRYAKNWAAGDGLLWNIHSPPVEGYTNFSFVALGALALKLGVNPIITLKIAGFIGLVALCIFLFLISRFWFGKRESLIPCISLLLYKGQIIWAVSGLETTVYQALICGSVFFSIRSLGYNFVPFQRGISNKSNFILAGLLLSLAGMTRPEAPVFMVLFFLLMLWDRPESGMKTYGLGLLLFALTIVMIFVPYFIWRWHYYGFLFPNSIYCKGFTNESNALDWHYLKFIWPFVLMAIPAVIKFRDKRHFFLWLPSLMYLLMLVHADPIVAFDNRLFLPAFALLLPLSLLGLKEVIFVLFKRDGGMLSIIIFLILFLFIPKMTLGQYRYFSQSPLQGEKLRMRVIQWLSQYAHSTDKVVIADAGMVPYYSNLDFIDSYCLNNLSMAHYPQSQRYEHFCQQILSDKSSIVILTSLLDKNGTTYTPSDLCFKKNLKHHPSYNLTKLFATNNAHHAYRYELFTNY